MATPSYLSPSLRTAPRFFATDRLLRTPLHFFNHLQKTYGDFVHYRGLLDFYFINTPDLVDFVLKQTNSLYDKRSPLYRRFANVTGDGLLSSEAEHWAQQRKLLQPEYKPRRVERLTPQITGPTQEMLQRWEPWIQSGQRFDIAAEMHHLTLQIAGRAFLDLNFEESSRSIEKWMSVFSEYVGKPPLPWVSDLRFPSWSNLQLKRARQAFTGFIRHAIDQSRARPEVGDDLLSRLLAAKASGTAMSELQLIDEVLTLIIAGHETASNALAWTWHFLSTHPECRYKLFEEVDRVLAGRTPTAADIDALRYTRMVAEESMRLAPPVWLITRSATVTHHLGGIKIPKRSMVVLCPYTLHRHCGIWSEPTRFRPERFSSGEAAHRPKHTFIPFGAGPHVCIGAHFAMMELIVIIAMIASHVQLTRTSRKMPKLRASFTLSPRNGLYVSARRRSPNANEPLLHHATN